MAIRNILQRLPGQKVAPTTLDGEAVLPMDTGRPARIGLWALGIGFGGFLLWAALAPLDEGVPTQGMVTIETKRKEVQHLSGGIVTEVLVKEGQMVTAGQVLLKLNDATVRANYESIRQHYLGMRAMEGRLMAEQAGQARITFHPDLLNNARDPVVKEQMTTQEQLFQSRRRALQTDLQGIEETIRGQQGQLESLAGILQSRRNQLALLQEELAGMRDLVKEGYAPRNRQMELERSVADVNAALADTQGNIVRVRSGIAELKNRAILRKQESLKEVDTLLADVRREVRADADKFKAASQDLARTEIRATASGQVVGLNVQTVGGIIQPGQKLMDIVPENEILLLETRVPPHLIDKIHNGLLADVRFATFAHTPQLVLEGKVESVSADLLTDPHTNQSYYLARVSITPKGMKTLGHRNLQAGMPGEVVIKTGERSVLTYLLHPLIKRMAGAMKEE